MFFTFQPSIILGSQGGGLTLATAVLCHDKIKTCAYRHPRPTENKNIVQFRNQIIPEIL